MPGPHQIKMTVQNAEPHELQSSFQQNLLSHLTHIPTGDQQKLTKHLEIFFNDSFKRRIFLLMGYAGTGKTTFINAIAKTIPGLNYQVVLLAPTGRAAKVISNYTGLEALTIHKKIYAIEPDKSGQVHIRINKLNQQPNTIYIIDEASMISVNTDRSQVFGERSLLGDLFDYVFEKPNCLVIFSGDTAQLPPVNEEQSKSLDGAFLNSLFNVKIFQFEMKEVVRQAKASGILMNATSLRILVSRKENFPILKCNGFSDVDVLYGTDISDTIQDAFGSRFDDEALVVCRSNKQANKYNQYIRCNILGQEDEISSGDSLMVVKNNYYWMEETIQTTFIANGDIIRIIKIGKIEEKFGFRFASVTIKMVDYPEEKEMDVKILLDTISSESPSLTQDQSKKLFNEVASSYTGTGGKINFRKVYQDPFLNALQVKFSYAVTCHKAQGGQWNVVFIDPGTIAEESYNTEYLRWLYTAITRAKNKLYFINMPEKFFKQ